MTGAVGIAGGILLGRTAMQRNRKVLGIPVPAKVDLDGVTHQIGEAGKQFGKRAVEIRNVTGGDAEVWERDALCLSVTPVVEEPWAERLSDRLVAFVAA